MAFLPHSIQLEFTPLEFETRRVFAVVVVAWLEFTPLEFETKKTESDDRYLAKLEFTPLEFETFLVVFF